MPEARAEIKFTILLATFLLVTLMFIVILAIVLYRVRRSKHMEETNELRSQFQEQLLMTQIEIQEQTLKNIAQEIHDNIGQTLSLAKLNLNTVNSEPALPDIEKIANSKDLLSKAIMDLRGLSRTLNKDSILATGLTRAIEFELQQIKRTGLFETGLNITGYDFKLDSQKELILFRIVQEALNNIIKHACASSILISISYDPNAFTLSVWDNGTGFETLPDKPSLITGSGLQNMRNRTQLIGGEFAIISAPASGTTISISLPTDKIMNASF